MHLEMIAPDALSVERKFLYLNTKKEIVGYFNASKAQRDDGARAVFRQRRC